jgi:glycerophosphoryl diester phosphodiesterase
MKWGNTMMVRGIARNGAAPQSQENTLSFLVEACRLGYSHVEIDIQMSKDGVPLLMRDQTINRMTDGKGRIRDYTLDELKQFKVKGTETIPTLEEALSFLKGRASVLIELHQIGSLYPGIEEQVLTVICRTGTLEQARIASLDHYSIARLRQLDSDIELGLELKCTAQHVFSFMKQIRCTFLGVNLRFMSSLFMDMMRDNGVVPGLWSIATDEDMETIAAKYPAALARTTELKRWAEFSRQRPEWKG